MTEKVLDFNSKRIENIEEKRRTFERVLFQNFLGCYTVIHQEGVIYPVELVDISSDGCLFQVPWDVKKGKKLETGAEVTLGSILPIQLIFLSSWNLNMEKSM